MADHGGLQHRGSDVFIAGEVLHLGDLRLVPVLQRRVGIARTGPVDSWSGYGECRLVGVWIAPGSGTPRFEPVELEPPGRARDWNAWLLQAPALLASIAAQLATSPDAGA